MRWQAFAAAASCPTLAVLRSRMVRRPDGTLDDGARSEIDLDGAPVRGQLVNLDRDGSNAPYQAAVTQFAEWLVERAQRRPLAGDDAGGTGC